MKVAALEYTGFFKWMKNREKGVTADIPNWVDYVFPGELLCELYNKSYKNINGYWNGTFLGANTNCMQTTTIDASSDEEEERWKKPKRR